MARNKMKAIIDCNSFYCSCERLFQPHLDDKPVVVLSNNDGCIISISNEARALGVKMAGPYFEAKPFIEKYNIATFSSNYNLYGDMSWRVMETLRIILGKENVEVYSVDEAFLDFKNIPENKLHETATHIKETVEQWTGIKVSIGVAPTKVLAKVANRLSKKDSTTNGVLVLQTPEQQMNALQQTKVESVWGVGRESAKKLWILNIRTAWELSKMKLEWAHKFLGGVVGLRLIKELRGEVCLEMEDDLVNKKMIATTRMFGQLVTNVDDIKEAIATYISKAAEKLRRQNSAASIISIFIVEKEQSHDADFKHGITVSSYTALPVATSATHKLIKPALHLVDKIFKDGTTYKKAGVMLSGIVPDTSVQGDLFISETKNCNPRLMAMIDNVNFAMRDDVLKFAASGTTRDWKMRMEFRSPRYTSRWNELFEVK